MLKGMTWVLVGLLLFVTWIYLPMGAHIVTGYSAKQLCSGVFVAGLPEEFIEEKDINPRMVFLGPALSLLDMQVDEHQKQAESRFLGFSSIAQYKPAIGCTLNPEAEVDAPISPQAMVLATGAAETPVAAIPAMLGAAFQRAFAEPVDAGRNTLALLVMHKGEVIAERYVSPVSVDTPMQGWSMNKSLVATWVGLQVKQGRLSLGLPVLEALQASGTELGDIEHKIDPALTLFNLLHMESGFDFVETYLPGDDATSMLYENAAMWRVAPENGHIYPPAEHFSYSSGDTNLATFLWQNSLADQHYTSWMNEHFWGPIGLRSVVSELDASGVQVGSSYTYMTARDWGRLGQFWLDAWHDRSDFLPQGWQRDATQPSASNTYGDYGLGFWLNTQATKLPTLPKNLFYAGGNAGQRVMVLPDQELVIVRLGLSESGVDHGVEAFVGELLAVLRAGGL